MKNKIQTRDGQPATGSPNINVFVIMTTIIIKETIKNNNPTTDEIAKGTVENATILSKEYKNNFQKLHLVVPATLSTFLYSHHLVS